MRNQNIVILNGRIGGDIVVKQSQSGKSVCSVNLAVSFDKNTEWYSIVFWEKLAETLEKYARKGSFIEIVGRLSTREWEKDGVKQKRVEIIANNLQLLDPKQSASNDKPSGGDDIPF